nr:MAG TPA: hypothetical protein [Caudoviricetes sp.]
MLGYHHIWNSSVYLIRSAKLDSDSVRWETRHVYIVSDRTSPSLTSHISTT